MSIPFKAIAKASGLTRKHIDALPDSHFLVTEKAYAEGRTTDKRARHLPIKDADGNMIDLAVVAQMIPEMKSYMGEETSEEIRKRAVAELDKLKAAQTKPPAVGAEKETPTDGGGQKMEKELKELQGQVDELKAALASAKAENEKLAKETDALRASEHAKVVAEKQKELDSLSGKMIEMEAAIAAANKVAEDAKAEVEALKAQNVELASAKKALEDEKEARAQAEAEANKAARVEQANALKDNVAEDVFEKLLAKAEDLAGTPNDTWDLIVAGYKGAKATEAVTTEDPHIAAAAAVGKVPVKKAADVSGPYAAWKKSVDAGFEKK